jgi:hypothetical protein
MSMNPKLQITTNGKTLGSIDLQPVTELRLRAYAERNEISLLDMIDLAIRFAIAPAESPVDLGCPDEADVIALAAKMLRKVA